MNLDMLEPHGVDVRTRTIYLGGDVDAAMAERAVKGLWLLDRAPGRKPITVIMNSPGGAEYSGLAIFDAISTCRSKVRAIVYGVAMSMGGIILQAADERLMAPNARFMMHYGTWVTPEDHPKIVYKWADEGKRFDEWMERLFLSRMRAKDAGITGGEVKRLLDFDTIYNAEETVARGLADSIIGITKKRVG